MNVEWVAEEDIPPSGERYSAGLEFARLLEENPGVWAKYPFAHKSPANFVYYQRNGKTKAFPPDRFESRHAKGVIYIRAVTA